MTDETPIHETTTEARAGDSNPVNRYVLVGSLVLVIVLFAAIVAFGWMG